MYVTMAELKKPAGWFDRLVLYLAAMISALFR
jgi:hypothetical protein